MSARGHRNDYIILAGLAVLLTAGVWFMTASEESESAKIPIRTTHSTHRQGVMACLMLYEKLGFSVSRSHAPLLSHHMEAMDVLLILDPIVALRSGERACLAGWVRDGGVLICTVNGFREVHGMIHEDSFSHVYSRRFDSYRGPLARDVVAADLADRRTIQADPNARTAPDLGSPRELLGDPDGPLIVERTCGRGRLIVLSDSSVLCNERLGEADNAVLAANLAAYSLTAAHGDRVVFDEYHLGFGGQEGGFSLLGGMLFSTPAGWAVLCLTAGGIGLLIHKGRRFGTRRPLRQRQRRTKMEFVRSAGATCRAAGANSLAFVLLYHWFRQKCAARSGLPASAGDADIAAALARIGPRSRGEYEKALARGAAVTVQRALSNWQFNKMLAMLADMEWETDHGHSTGQ